MSATSLTEPASPHTFQTLAEVQEAAASAYERFKRIKRGMGNNTSFKFLVSGHTFLISQNNGRFVSIRYFSYGGNLRSPRESQVRAFIESVLARHSDSAIYEALVAARTSGVQVDTLPPKRPGERDDDDGIGGENDDDGGGGKPGADEEGNAVETEGKEDGARTASDMQLSTLGNDPRGGSNEGAFVEAGTAGAPGEEAAAQLFFGDGVATVPSDAHVSAPRKSRGKGRSTTESSATSAIETAAVTDVDSEDIGSKRPVPASCDAANAARHHGLRESAFSWDQAQTNVFKALRSVHEGSEEQVRREVDGLTRTIPRDDFDRITGGRNALANRIRANVMKTIEKDCQVSLLLAAYDETVTALMKLARLSAATEGLASAIVNGTVRGMPDADAVRGDSAVRTDGGTSSSSMKRTATSDSFSSSCAKRSHTATIYHRTMTS